MSTEVSNLSEHCKGQFQSSGLIKQEKKEVGPPKLNDSDIVDHADVMLGDVKKCGVHLDIEFPHESGKIQTIKQASYERDQKIEDAAEFLAQLAQMFPELPVDILEATIASSTSIRFCIDHLLNESARLEQHHKSSDWDLVEDFNRNVACQDNDDIVIVSSGQPYLDALLSTNLAQSYVKL